MKTAKKAAKSPTKMKGAVVVGSGNVFADLGLPDAKSLLAKAELAREVGRLIAARKLSQSQAAATLGIDQPKVSALLRGKLDDFSTERLMRFITALDQDVVISIRPAPAGTAGSLRVSIAS